MSDRYPGEELSLLTFHEILIKPTLVSWVHRIQANSYSQDFVHSTRRLDQTVPRTSLEIVNLFVSVCIRLEWRRPAFENRLS